MKAIKTGFLIAFGTLAAVFMFGFLLINWDEIWNRTSNMIQNGYRISPLPAKPRYGPYMVVSQSDDKSRYVLMDANDVEYHVYVPQRYRSYAPLPGEPCDLSPVPDGYQPLPPEN